MATSNRGVETRQLTLRLSRGLYARAQQLAKARNATLNGFMRQLLEEVDRTQRERELQQAYELLGQDAEANVEPMLDAQAEVVRRG
jgi:predicted transcriptional regulator